MPECCSPPPDSTHHKERCPMCKKESAGISVQTIVHHIKHSWQWHDTDQKYYFCENPHCEVVYFAKDDTAIMKSQLHTTVGLKTPAEDATLCYCFGVGKADAIRNPSIREFVLTKTKQGICSCESSNPSGRCCLKYFPITMPI